MVRKVFKYVLLAVIAVNLAICLWVFFGPASSPRLVMPIPNGYDDFVKAGQMIAPGYSYDYQDMKKDALARLVATNAEALKIVREGLGRECCAPNDYTNDYMMMLASNLMQLKGLALDLCAEGRLKILDEKTNDGIASYLDAMRFGQEMGRGGVMIVKLVGIACESSARSDLKKMMNSLAVTECRHIILGLEKIDGREEPVETNLKREKAFIRATTTSPGQKIESLLQWRETRKDFKDFTDSFNANLRKRRQLMIDFAVRAYELEKGRQPQSVAELVPDYLKAVPKDPATAKELSLLGR